MTKTCTKCEITKPIDDFSVNKRNKTDGRQPKCKACNAQYYAERSDKIKKRVNEHYHSNHDRMLKERAELRKRPEAKIKKAEQDRNYRAKTKEKIDARYKAWAKVNRDKLRAARIRWYYSDIEHARMMSIIKNHRRKQHARNNGNNTLTVQQAKDLLLRNPKCQYCGSTEKLSIDHIIPLSRGGQNCLDNIAIACLSCNCSKNNKMLDEWC